MHIESAYLHLYRKRAHLTREDVAFVLHIGSLSDISRWETGARQPKVSIVLVYHLLFNIPMQTLFTPQTAQLVGTLCERITLRIQELEVLPPDPKVRSRIAFLESTLNRLRS